MTPSPLLTSHLAHLLLIPPSTLPHSRLAATFLPAILTLNFYSWYPGLGMLVAPQALSVWSYCCFDGLGSRFVLLVRRGRRRRYDDDEGEGEGDGGWVVREEGY